MKAASAQGFLTTAACWPAQRPSQSAARRYLCCCSVSMFRAVQCPSLPAARHSSWFSLVSVSQIARCGLVLVKLNPIDKPPFHSCVT